ncbi:MAG TPA: nitrate- and nitrite sensing domain-containing protein, partial [Actinomycetes bacterium]
MSNWRVRSKLIAVLVIPAIAFLVLASFGLGSSVRDARAIGQGTRLAELGRQVTALAHELQSERDQTAGYIERARQGVPPAQARQALIDQRRRVDDAAGDYRAAEAELYDGLGQRLRGRFDAVREGLDGLAGLRETVTSASLPERAAFEEFSQIVDSLLDVDLEIAQPGGNEELAQKLRAFNDLSRLKEVTSQVRGTLYAIAIRDAFAFGEFQSFADLLAQQRAALDQFQADANETQRGLFADVVRGQAVLTVSRSQQAAVNRQANPTLGIDREQWQAASSTQIELLRSVESRLLNDVVQQSRSLSTSTNRRLALNALLIAGILAVALLALLVVARSMARPLQRLQAGALDIAEHRLPAAVERLRTADSADLDVDVEPIGIRSKEEIGQVAQAVDAIQRVAVRLATEQAALRRSIGDMFTNLARRSQTLIDRQLELIEDLERNETDPETLEHLFRLDHLATRMRRNAEDLIVLSGAEPARRWSQPVPLVDVIRAALAEVEDYNRVELLPIDDVGVAGQAVSDTVHLLAELIENATSFSPPGTKVQVAGQQVSNGYVVEIEDRGLGMSDEELVEANERLANPPMVDFALSRMLGLYVVGRLAQRYGVKVQLRHSWYGGITALALLPPNLVVRSTIESLEAPAARRGPAELAAPAQPTGAVTAEEAGADGSAGDHLPIFEAARSDWFESGAGGTH